MIMLDFLHLDYIFLVLGFNLNFDFFSKKSYKKSYNVTCKSLILLNWLDVCMFML